jgi:imidazolonepropionase-like amidohydrolase
MRPKLFLFCAACALATAGAAADVLLIMNARVVPVSGPPIDDAGVMVRDGRIMAVGRAMPLIATDRVIDAGGATVYPGFFAGYTQLGLVEIDAVDMTNDTDEASGVNTAQVQALDGYNPHSSLIPITRVNGVTHVLSAPSAQNLFSGQSFVARLDGATVDEVAIRNPAALHVTLGEAPKRRFGGKNQMPSTRMGIAAAIRAEFTKAGEYAAQWHRHEEALAKHAGKLAEYESKVAEGDEEAKEPAAPTPPKRDLRMEPFVRALNGEIPVAFHADRLDDIETALRLADEFGLRAVLIGGADAYKIADRLAAANVPVILDTTEQPGAMATQGAIYENAAALARAGVKIAFMTGDTSHNVRNLPYSAGLAVAYGLPRDEALRALTVNPAEIWGVDGDYGTVEPGKVANLFIADGDPLQPTTRITHVLIDGVEIPLETRQKDLARQFGGEHTPAALAE